MTHYDLGEWSDFFVATAGASAALAGLVFVAVSINIDRILALKGVPERGLHTVVLLLGALVISVFGLVPHRPRAFAVEALVIGVVLVGVVVATARATLTNTRGHPTLAASRLLATFPGSAAYAVAGISLLAGAGGGLTWVVVGIVGALIGGVVNAWVLLVEILRRPLARPPSAGEYSAPSDRHGMSGGR